MNVLTLGTKTLTFVTVSGGAGERRLEVDRRVLAYERRTQVVAAHAAPGRLARHQVLLAAFGIDQRDAVEHVGALAARRVLERPGWSPSVNVSRSGSSSPRCRRPARPGVEDDRRAAALELVIREHEPAAVGAAVPLGDWCRGRALRSRRVSQWPPRRRVGRRRGARGVLVVAATAPGQQRQRRDQREKSSHADERYPTGAPLTPSACAGGTDGVDRITRDRCRRDPAEEPVDRPRPAHVLDRDARFPQRVHVRLALVAQDVGLGGDDVRGRHAREVVRAQRRGVRHPPSAPSR